MKKKLLIIGAGNVGGFLSYNISEFAVDYEILGFLDDDPEKIGNEMYGRKVLGPVSAISNYQQADTDVVIGIANPLAKEAIAKTICAYSFNFPSFIAKNVWLSNQVKVGRGVILYPGVSINYETNLGDFVLLNMNCAIGHNCIISKYSTLAPGVNLAGFTFIDETVDIGIGVSTRQNIHIGKKASIGGQAMITKNVRPNTKVKGVPAREY